MKVALVHDWLTGLRGGERCLLAFLDLFPEADIHCLLHVPGTVDDRVDARVKGTSFIQKLPNAERWYRHCLPLYPLAVRGLDLEGYDLVISLSHAAAKNVRVPAKAVHLCYCFTPMRYIWDQSWQYFGAATPFLMPLFWYLRAWDRLASKRPNMIIAISKFISARIRHYYGRYSDVIYPPVNTSWIKPRTSKAPGEAFLSAGALVPYKNADVIVRAFNQLDEQLWVVGSGPIEPHLKKIAGPNVKFFGRVSDPELAELYARSKALVYPVSEDFGMVPVECMAAGRPVIGLNAGGLKETVHGLRLRDPNFRELLAGGGYTGLFIDQKRNKRKIEAELVEAIKVFGQVEGMFSAEDCVKQAAKFSPENFSQSWERLLDELSLSGTCQCSETLDQKGGVINA